MNSFPQPTRPINSHDFEPIHIQQLHQHPTTAYMENHNVIYDQSLHYSIRPTTTELTGEKKETAEELLRAIGELYAKLPASIRSQVNLDKFNIPKKVQNRFEIDPTTTQSRGVTTQGSLEELSMKLERFKIKTIELGEVVMEEEEKK